MKTRIKLLLILGVIFSSCSTVAHLSTDDTSQKYSATNAENIEIYSIDNIGKDYTIIGDVIASADAGTDASVTIKYLKKEAAKMGADGIINLKLEIDYGYWSNAIKATGVAVKFSN